MSFLLRCPNCGERSAYEFSYGGESGRPRPETTAPGTDWADYLYARKNVCGDQKEWWYHQQGCRTWFHAIRDTRTNTVRTTFDVEDSP